MSNLSKGKYAQFISDRSGQAFPYQEMVIEWNGSRVHVSEFEAKHPQLEPKPTTADGQGLRNARPQIFTQASGDGGFINVDLTLPGDFSFESKKGQTYQFDQSAGSNETHPLRLSTTSDGTHNSGTEYTTGVTTNGVPGNSGAYTQIVVDASAPSTLYYYCSSHSGMGGQINIS